MIYFTVLVFAAFSVCSEQFLNCGWVRSLDCTRYPNDPKCGTNGVTYSNSCEFAKAQCNNKSLHVAAFAACAGNVVGTTSGSGPIVTQQPQATTVNNGPTPTHAHVFFPGLNAVLDFFCLELSHEKCPTDTEQVCGEDNKTYANFCEFEKARCTHRDLDVASFGSCP